MARPDKAAAIAELTEKFRQSAAVLLTEYRGLRVDQLQELRRSLSGVATYAVAKNTLASIAAKEAGLGEFAESLSGPSALVFVNGEAPEAAKTLKSFAKANPMLVIKGGVLDGNVLSADDVSKLAELESRDVLLAKAAGVLKASMFQAAYVFTAPASKAVRTIEALREKQEAASPAAE
ncbi:MAG TPA: 50S ribosomal protein L10 [Actinomycetaceae bacterium]|nr:50S ribosomal protein L10 [Actinomycetaceae bacterium]